MAFDDFRKCQFLHPIILTRLCDCKFRVNENKLSLNHNVIIIKVKYDEYLVLLVTLNLGHNNDVANGKKGNFITSIFQFLSCYL